MHRKICRLTYNRRHKAESKGLRAERRKQINCSGCGKQIVQSAEQRMGRPNQGNIENQKGVSRDQSIEPNVESGEKISWSKQHSREQSSGHVQTVD
jgi:hypothetical protein